MKKRTAVTLVIGALVLGLFAGSVGIATAATGEADGDGDGRTTFLEILASLTGLSEDEVVEQRREGASFPRIAEEAGVSTDEIIEELYTEQAARIQDLLDDGLITQEQADWALDNLADRIEERVLSDGLMGHGPGMRGGGPGMRGSGSGGGPSGGPGCGPEGGPGKGGFGGPGGAGCWDAPADDAPTNDVPEA